MERVRTLAREILADIRPRIVPRLSLAILLSLAWGVLTYHLEILP